MPERWNKVLLVVDSNYGERLHSLSADAVWLIDSPANRKAAEVFWMNGETTVTTFKSALSSPNADALGILSMLDLHHGECSGGYLILEVVGASLDTNLRSAIKELGFSTFEPTSEGFSAGR